MTLTTDCPHISGEIRDCPGCTNVEEGERWCDGEISGRVYADSDGDPGVVYGVRHFVAVEDQQTTCGCTLSEQEWQTVTDTLCAIGSEPPQPEDAPDFPY